MGAVLLSPKEKTAPINDKKNIPERERRHNMKNGAKVIGSAEIGAYMHRNNGGKVNISSYTSVNKKLTTDTADETTRIAHKRFEIIEKEVPELDGNKFYSKDIWNEQTDMGGQTGTYPGRNNNSSYEQPEEAKQGLSPLQVLKNFVDNIAADVRQHTWLIVAIGVIAALALGCGIAALIA